LLRLSLGATGIAQAVPVREGQRVTKGQVILQLDDRAARAELRTSRAQLQAARARMQASQGRLEPLRVMADRLRQAAQAGAGQEHLADEALQRLEQARADVGVASAEVQVAQGLHDQARARLAQLTLRAPEEGALIQLDAHAGVTVQPDRPVAVLLPHRRLIVRAEVNETFVDTLRPGMRAIVQTDGEATARELPAARLARLSQVFATSRLQEDNQRGPVRAVDCILEFETEPQARVGQIVRVSIYE
jgi:multidrug resistance efflux pump